MQLTLFTDYSIRVLMYVSREKEHLVTIREISDYYGISMEHMRKVIHKLAKCGYLDSFRGKYGGVQLAKSPKDIRLGKVVLDMEEDMSIMNCKSQDCILDPDCSLKGALKKASHSFVQVLNEYTLADLLGNRSLKRRFKEIDSLQIA